MAVFMHVPSVRATMWPSLVLSGIALLLGLYSVAKIRPLGALRGIGAVLGLLIAGLFILNYFTGFQTPREPGRVVSGVPLPAISLKTEAVAELKVPHGKPVLLVFYRGFW